MGASEYVTMFFQVMSGLGIFFTGVGVLWFVTVYIERRKSSIVSSLRDLGSLPWKIAKGLSIAYSPILEFDTASTEKMRPNSGLIPGLP